MGFALKKENFDAYVEHPDSAEIGPFFGWLCTKLDVYAAETLSLKTTVYILGGKLRPLIEVEPTDHPLAVHQREGISRARAWEIVHHYTPKKSAR
jgi:hypothetical protein